MNLVILFAKISRLFNSPGGRTLMGKGENAGNQENVNLLALSSFPIMF